MKKLIICMILLSAMLLTITGCGNGKKTQGVGVAGDANSGISGSGEIPTPTFETYESYLKFIKSADLPDNFVTYEMISDFGEFKSFVCAPPSYGYNEYNYSIIDKDSDVELTIYVDHGEELTITDNTLVISSSDVIANDMRKLPNQEEGVKSFVQSGVCYTYLHGKLLSVAWVDNGIRYTISGDLDICSLDSSSALSKLLKLESAGDAIASVKRPTK